MLTRINFPSSVDQRVLPADVLSRIKHDCSRIEAFQDRWDRPQIEQFVAADYSHVYQVLDWTLETQIVTGRRFLEWGCGFAVVSSFASRFDLDVIGIEAEQELLVEGHKTTQAWKVSAELIQGNFLPPGSDSLADDPTLPSLGHPVPDAYEQLELDLDDFAIVYSYPWPGEDDFHEAVFDRYAGVGSLLILFCGPNDIRVWRKVR
ncbi:MAG: class I SAM-dependent methyltransferase [Rubripirellula sp.]